MLRYPDRELPSGHPERRLLSAVAGELGVAAEGVALAPSLSAFVDDALALRPMLSDAPRQAALTRQFLAPVLPGLDLLFRWLRAEAEPALRKALPTRNGAPWPYGRCLEITLVVEARLRAPAPTSLPRAAAEAWVALQAFGAAGGEVRRAWGDRRGEYFQNALLVGSLYVDVANDTVVATKPPVQILPLGEADFRPIENHLHFARIAGRYWKHQVLPNHILPELAPYAPLIQVAPGGGLRLGPLAPYMLSLTLADRFASSEAALASSSLPPGVFAGLRAVLRGNAGVAASPEAGRAGALAACRAARAEARFACPNAFNRAVLAAHAINRRLAGFQALPAAA